MKHIYFLLIFCSFIGSSCSQEKQADINRFVDADLQPLDQDIELVKNSPVEQNTFFIKAIELFKQGQKPTEAILQKTNLVGLGLVCFSGQIGSKGIFNLFSWNNNKSASGLMGNICYLINQSAYGSNDYIAKELATYTSVNDYLYNNQRPFSTISPQVIPPNVTIRDSVKNTPGYAYKQAKQLHCKNFDLIEDTKGVSKIMVGKNGFHYIRQNGNYLIILQGNPINPATPKNQIDLKTTINQTFLQNPFFVVVIPIDDSKKNLYEGFITK